MISVSNTEWLADYSSLKALLLRKRKTGLPSSPDEFTFYNNAASSLEAKLKIMASTPHSHGLAGSEQARRQVLIDNIKKQLGVLGGTREMDGSYAHEITAESEVEAVAEAETVIFNSGRTNSAAYNALFTSELGLQMRATEVESVHDSLLNDIGSGVSRLHGLAHGLHEEVDIHEALLDSMNDSVDMATISLQAEARRAAALKEKVVSLRLYLCLAVEVAVLLLLLTVVAQ